MNLNRESEEVKKLFDYYMELANKGIAFAQSYIADAFFWGWGCQPEFSKFIEWDTIAAKNGSRVSGRRMFLYYYSIGNLEAAGTLYLFRFNGETGVLPAMGHVYDVNKFIEIYKNYGSTKRFLDAYRDAVDVSDEYKRNYRRFREEPHKILSAICYIYGFGVEANYNSAMQYLKSFDHTGDCLTGIENEWAHYILSVFETGYEVDREYLKNLTSKMYLELLFVDEETAGCFIRHAIRLALLGNLDAAVGLGNNIQTKKDTSDNKRRKYFYHDDKDALFWLSLAAEKPGCCHATMDAISLSSDVSNVAFNFDYAKQVCYYALNNHNFNKNSDSDFDDLTKSYAADGLTNLAIWVNDISEKNQLGHDALDALMQLANENGEFRNPKYIGMIYCEIFKDYKQALPWFEEAAQQGWDVERYINICKKNRNSSRSQLQNENAGSGCYIATCVYGSYACPEVWTLRRYRDNILAATRHGRAFVSLYYAISPRIVSIFGDQRWFRFLWKKALDKLVAKLQSRGVESTPYDDVQW